MALSFTPIGPASLLTEDLVASLRPETLMVPPEPVMDSKEAQRTVGRAAEKLEDAMGTAIEIRDSIPGVVEFAFKAAETPEMAQAALDKLKVELENNGINTGNMKVDGGNIVIPAEAVLEVTGQGVKLLPELAQLEMPEVSQALRDAMTVPAIAQTPVEAPAVAEKPVEVAPMPSEPAVAEKPPVEVAPMPSEPAVAEKPPVEVAPMPSEPAVAEKPPVEVAPMPSEPAVAEKPPVEVAPMPSEPAVAEKPPVEVAPMPSEPAVAEKPPVEVAPMPSEPAVAEKPPVEVAPMPSEPAVAEKPPVEVAPMPSEPAVAEKPPVEVAPMPSEPAKPVTEQELSDATKGMNDFLNGKGSIDEARKGQETVDRYLQEQAKAAAMEGNDEKAANLLLAIKENQDMSKKFDEELERRNGGASQEKSGLNPVLDQLLTFIKDATGIDLKEIMGLNKPAQEREGPANETPVTPTTPTEPAPATAPTTEPTAAKPEETGKANDAKEIAAALSETRQALETQFRREMGLSEDAPATPELKEKVKEAMGNAVQDAVDTMKLDGSISAVDAAKAQASQAKDGITKEMERERDAISTAAAKVDGGDKTLDDKEKEAAIKSMDKDADGKINKTELEQGLAEASGLKLDAKEIFKDDKMAETLAGLRDALKSAGVYLDQEANAPTAPKSTTVVRTEEAGRNM